MVPSPQSNSSRCPASSTIWLGPARCKQGCGVPVPVRISLIAVPLPNLDGLGSRRPSLLTAVYIPRVYPCVGQELRESLGAKSDVGDRTRAIQPAARDGFWRCFPADLHRRSGSAVGPGPRRDTASP